MTNSKYISSTSNEHIKNLKKLHSKKYRDLTNQFLVSGEHLVQEALKKGIVVEILDSSKESKYYFFNNTYKVSHHIIEYLSETITPQSVIALCDKTLLKNTRLNKVIALNNLQDPGNVGTIIRLAKSFDFDTVIIENLDPFNDKVIRSSQGALFDINIITTKDLKQYLENLKSNNFKIYTTLLDKDSKALNEVNFLKENIVIVFGNEGSGIYQNIIELTDEKVYIPISFESLNVACCASIILNKVRNG